MALSNMSERAEIFVGLSENADPERICLAVSGWLLITTGCTPRLRYNRWSASHDLERRASFL